MRGLTECSGASRLRTTTSGASRRRPLGESGDGRIDEMINCGRRSDFGSPFHPGLSFSIPHHFETNLLTHSKVALSLEGFTKNLFAPSSNVLL